MLGIIKEYMKIYKSNSYSIISVKNIIVTALIGLILYTQGANGNIHKLNTVMVITFSILIIMFSSHSINGELFINVNRVKFKEEQFYKKIIASNISFILQIILYILAFITINIYFLGYSKVLDLLVQIIPIMILSTAIGNLLLIINKKVAIYESRSIIQNVIKGGISVVLGILLCYLYYNYNFSFFIPVTLAAYILSVVINERFGFH